MVSFMSFSSPGIPADEKKRTDYTIEYGARVIFMSLPGFPAELVFSKLLAGKASDLFL